MNLFRKRVADGRVGFALKKPISPPDYFSFLPKLHIERSRNRINILLVSTLVTKKATRIVFKLLQWYWYVKTPPYGSHVLISYHHTRSSRYCERAMKSIKRASTAAGYVRIRSTTLMMS